jgi:hypothetical protein
MDSKMTLTLSVDLQSAIARALDDDEFSLVSSLDLIGTFDIVNIKLLIKRMKIIGLPDDKMNWSKCGWKTENYTPV